ncbi:MAG: AraC family transcriptional regulator [Agriterribacter sp.]
MKPQLHKVPLHNDSSFVYQKLNCKYFEKPWHFHEEYELMVIEKSRGTKFIGDKVNLFEEGEMMLIGSNIPHLFRNHEAYYEDNKKLRAKSIFIHFTDNFLGNHFFEVPEMKKVKKLLDQSAYALQILGKTREHVYTRLNDIEEMQPAQRLICLLEILIHLSESKELKPLLSNHFVAQNRISSAEQNKKDTDRIHKVFEYIMKNYKKEIYLSEVASMLNMSSVSFSRYFKHHTQKTFSEYVTEVRISHACNLLMNDNENISQICYSSGFENLSNFYKHFKKVTGVIPKDYRNRFLLRS